MKKRLVALLSTCFLAIISINLYATTYYVDPLSGNDAASGKLATEAWKHIPGSLTSSPSVFVQAGDVILVKGGTIQQDSILVNSSHYKNGTSSSMIVIKSGEHDGFGTGMAVIDGGATPAKGAGTWGKGFQVYSRNYIRIEGFEIRNLANVTDSAGIWVDGSSSYCQIVKNTIHESFGDLGSSGYGIAITGSTTDGYHTVEKNVVYHTEEKAIAVFYQGHCTVRYNYLHEGKEHLMVIMSQYNDIYDNICSKAGDDWMQYLKPDRPAFGIKFDSGTTSFANNNNCYNNIIYGCSSGLGILNGSYNKIYHNTVYYSGLPPEEAGGVEGAAFVLIDDGTTSELPVGNDIKNNLFYFGALIYSKAATLVFNKTIGGNNSIVHNLIYRDSSNVGTLVYYVGDSATWNTVDWLQGATGFSSVSTGNNASDNIVMEPQLLGGSQGALLGSAPTGFDDTDWTPNVHTFSLSGATPEAVRVGVKLGSPFDKDVQGNPRTGYSVGAYEYVDPVIEAPKHLRLK
jgi:hypothetical protein